MRTETHRAWPLKRCSQKHGIKPRKSQWPKSSLLEQRSLKLIRQILNGARLDGAILTKATIWDKRSHYWLFQPEENGPIAAGIVEPMMASPTDFPQVGFFTCHHRLINGRAFHNGPINRDLSPGRTRIKSPMWISSAATRHSPITENFGLLACKSNNFSTALGGIFTHPSPQRLWFQEDKRG